MGRRCGYCRRPGDCGRCQRTVQGKQQQPPDQSKIFQKIPEVTTAHPVFRPEIGELPEWVIEDGGDDTERRQYQRRRAGVPGDDDTNRRDELDYDRHDEQRRCRGHK